VIEGGGFMKIVAYIVIFVLVGLITYVNFQGLDIRKPVSWLFGIIGFLCGLALGFFSDSNPVISMAIGVGTAVLIMAQGLARHRHKRNYGNVKHLFSPYVKGDRSSIFSKLAKKLLNKNK
jgi:hypothetical protein